MIPSKGYADKTISVGWLNGILSGGSEPHDVLIDILYCGVCHSDIHQASNEWNNAVYPMVPGHEIIGRVVKSLGAG